MGTEIKLDAARNDTWTDIEVFYDDKENCSVLIPATITTRKSTTVKTFHFLQNDDSSSTFTTIYDYEVPRAWCRDQGGLSRVRFFLETVFLASGRNRIRRRGIRQKNGRTTDE